MSGDGGSEGLLLSVREESGQGLCSRGGGRKYRGISLNIRGWRRWQLRTWSVEIMALYRDALPVFQLRPGTIPGVALRHRD